MTSDGQVLREPPMAGDETAILLELLERQRRIFAWKCGGLNAAGAPARVGASAITLGGLLIHLAAVEALYFSHRLHGRDPGRAWNAVDWDDRPVTPTLMRESVDGVVAEDPSE